MEVLARKQLRDYDLTDSIFLSFILSNFIQVLTKKTNFTNTYGILNFSKY